VNSHTEDQQHFRSNRRHYRIRADFPCEVGQPDGDLHAVQVLDISIGGLKFSCSYGTVNNIIPDGERTIGLIMDVGIDVQFELSSGSTRSAVIKTGARIIHSERLAQDVFHIGIQFNRLDTSVQRQLETYIDGLES
jgi:hypothetical protein